MKSPDKSANTRIYGGVHMAFHVYTLASSTDIFIIIFEMLLSLFIGSELRQATIQL
jgi:hypothetical protein